MNQTRGRKKGSWNAEVVRSTQAAIKVEILSCGLDDSERLKWILDKTFSSTSKSDEDQMRRYIYCVSALVHHLRFGGLTEKQMNLLIKMSFSILDLAGVPETSSQSSFLYEDVHNVLAHIHRKNGSFWLASWEHEAGGRSSSDESSGLRTAVSAVGSAIRKIRLGMVERGISTLQQALQKEDLDSFHKPIALTNLLKALRIAGRVDEAEALDVEMAKMTDLPPETNLERSWERQLRAFLKSREIRPLADALVRKGPFAQEWSYSLEGIFWISAAPEAKYREQAPSAFKIKKNLGKGLQEERVFIDFACCIDDCYDSEIPFNSRIQKLGAMLNDSKKILTIDREILVWAAAARWLIRSRNHALLELVMCEYQQLSSQVTSGRSRDALGFFIGEETLRRAS